MELGQFPGDEGAVSPVIGVILVVAITVILAAVVGTYALGLGSQVDDAAPQVRFAFDYTAGGTGTANCDVSGTESADGVLEITHDSGSEVPIERLGLVSSTGDGRVDDFSNCYSSPPSDVAAGSTSTVSVDADATVRVVWTSTGREPTTATLDSWSRG
jgi:flagellin-like protein